MPTLAMPSALFPIVPFGNDDSRRSISDEITAPIWVPQHTSIWSRCATYCTSLTAMWVYAALLTVALSFAMGMHLRNAIERQRPAPNVVTAVLPTTAPLPTIVVTPLPTNTYSCPVVRTDMSTKVVPDNRPRAFRGKRTKRARTQTAPPTSIAIEQVPLTIDGLL